MDGRYSCFITKTLFDCWTIIWMILHFACISFNIQSNNRVTKLQMCGKVLKCKVCPLSSFKFLWPCLLTVCLNLHKNSNRYSQEYTQYREPITSLMTTRRGRWILFGITWQKNSRFKGRRTKSERSTLSSKAICGANEHTSINNINIHILTNCKQLWIYCFHFHQWC